MGTLKTLLLLLEHIAYYVMNLADATKEEKDEILHAMECIRNRIASIIRGKEVDDEVV